MDKCKKLIRIGELAKISGLPKSTIRYYNEIGILKEAERTASGYRLFDKEESLNRLKAIREIISSKPTLRDLKERLVEI